MENNNTEGNKKRIERLTKLAEMADEDIDYSDIPPITDFSGFTRLHQQNSEIIESVTIHEKMTKEDKEWNDFALEQLENIEGWK